DRKRRTKDRYPLSPADVVSHPLARRHVVRADPHEPLALEELLGTLVDAAGEEGVESQCLTLLENPCDQSVAQTFSLEAVDGVEADDLASALRGVGRRQQPRTPRQVPPAHGDAEARAQDPGNLLRRAQPQHALARTALEQSLGLLVLVEGERADARVVAFREQRPRAGVAEELVR